MAIVTPGGGLPRVIAHRGSSLAFPEHTRAAYLRALDEGADGLECDVRLTRDLVPVLLHDGRLDATTDASGPVGERTADELDAVLVSARRTLRRRRRDDRRARLDGPGASVAGGGAGDAGERETGVLRLADFLAVAAAAGRPVELALETKHPARSGRQIESAVVAALATQPALRPGARVMSFSAAALRRLRELDPQLPTVLLLADPHAGHRSALPPWVDSAGPSVRQLHRDPELVARMHDEGHEVHVWTVDADADLDHCVALGVDVVITNRPAHVLRRLGR